MTLTTIPYYLTAYICITCQHDGGTSRIKYILPANWTINLIAPDHEGNSNAETVNTLAHVACDPFYCNRLARPIIIADRSQIDAETVFARGGRHMYWDRRFNFLAKKLVTDW